MPRHLVGCDNISQNMKRNLTLLLAPAICLLTSCSRDINTLANNVEPYAFGRNTLVRPIDQSVSDGSWDMPAGLTGPKLIVIDTGLQQAKFYVGNRLVGWSTISSGKAGHGTPKGTFKIQSKDIDHRSSTYGSIVDAYGNTLVENWSRGMSIPRGGIYKGAEMNFGMQIVGGIWMHEGFVTSAPESHGCIRLPRRMAQIFYENTPVGTPVIIK